MKQCLSALRCPVCKKHMFMRDHSLICKKGHCFDLAKTGYVNFSAAKDDTYPRALFESRQRIHQAGFYDPLIEAVTGILQQRLTALSPLIVDAGCGEGFILSRTVKRFPSRGIGFDISREAIRLASRLSKDILWMVADLGDIPIKNGQAAAILNILTPAAYGEFARVLTKGGLIIKAVPGSAYLKELRELAGDKLQHTEYSNQPTIDYFKQNARLIETRRLAWSLPLSPEQAEDIARMTPMLSHVDVKTLDLGRLTKITIEMDLLVGEAAAKK